jgi:hypothetical protein
MSARGNKVHPALKHGGYSASTILPGESVAEFEKLHRDLIAEFSPTGRYEEHNIATMAQVLWRLQNLATFRIASQARARRHQLTDEKAPPSNSFSMFDEQDPVARAERKEAFRLAENQTRKEFGAAYELVEMGEAATIEALERELEIQERLEAMLERCLKRLLFSRGVKSISPASAPTKRVAGPREA